MAWVNMARKTEKSGSRKTGVVEKTATGAEMPDECDEPVSGVLVTVKMRGMPRPRNLAELERIETGVRESLVAAREQIQAMRVELICALNDEREAEGGLRTLKELRELFTEGD